MTFHFSRIACITALCAATSFPSVAAEPRNAPTPAAPAPASRPLSFEPGTLIPNGAAPPVLRVMLEQGIKLTSLGEVSNGIMGYLGESTDRKYQVFYVMPDGVTLMVGLAYRLGNQPAPTLENITAQQVIEMQRRIDATRHQTEESRRASVEAAESARKRAEDAAHSQQDKLIDLDARRQQADDALRQLGGNTVPSTAPTMPVISAPISPLVLPLPQTNPAPRADAAPLIPENKDAASNIPVSSVDKDKLLADLQGRNMLWVDIGPADAPMLLMVVDPKCPFCHRAWITVRSLIQEKKVRARIVLIPASPGSDADTISLLARQDKEIGLAFWKGEGSAEGQPVSPPPPSDSPEYKLGLERARKNMEFVQRYAPNINRTPFMAYVAADGKLRSLDGLNNMDSFLKGLPQSPAVAR